VARLENVVALHEQEQRWLDEQDDEREQTKERELIRYVDDLAREASPSTDARVLAEARASVWAVIDTSEVFWNEHEPELERRDEYDAEPYLSEEDEQLAMQWGRESARKTLLQIARRQRTTYARLPQRHAPERRHVRRRPRERRARRTTSSRGSPSGDSDLEADHDHVVRRQVVPA